MAIVAPARGWKETIFRTPVNGGGTLFCLGFDFCFCCTLTALFNIKITGPLDWLPSPQMAIRRTWCCIYVTAVP